MAELKQDFEVDIDNTKAVKAIEKVKKAIEELNNTPIEVKFKRIEPKPWYKFWK